jgi:hypothetical protein
MFNNIFDDVITMQLQDIYNNLNTISTIKPFDKIYHNDKNILIEDSYLPFISRYYRGSNRNDTIKFIKYILTQSFFHLEMLKNSLDKKSYYLYITLKNTLKNSIVGLINLQKTYCKDTKIVYEIQKNINFINNLYKN